MTITTLPSTTASPASAQRRRRARIRPTAPVPPAWSCENCEQPNAGRRWRCVDCGTTRE